MMIPCKFRSHEGYAAPRHAGDAADAVAARAAIAERGAGAHQCSTDDCSRELHAAA